MNRHALIIGPCARRIEAALEPLCGLISRVPDAAAAVRALAEAPFGVVVLAGPAAPSPRALVDRLRAATAWGELAVLALVTPAEVGRWVAETDLEPMDIVSTEAPVEEIGARFQRLCARVHLLERDPTAAGLGSRVDLLERMEGMGTFAWWVREGRLSFSPQMYRHLGVDPETFVPTDRSVAAMVHPDDRERLHESFDTSLVTCRPFTLTCRVVRADRQVVWLRTRSRVVCDDDGRPVRVLGSCTDVTQQKRSEERLLAARNHLRALHDAAPDAVFIYTSNGELLDVNERVYDLFGWTRDEILDGEMSILFDVAGDEGGMEDALVQALSGLPVALRRTLKRKNGELFQVDVRIRRLELSEDSANEGARLVAVARDVSEYVQLEQDLQHSRKMETVGRLAGGIAHDFNNLLTSVIGNLDLIESRRELSSELAEIRWASDRASELTRQLLAFSRRQHLVPRVVCLNEPLEEMQRLLGRLIGEDIEVSFEPSPDLWALRVDPGQVQQLLLNLAVNARDAMPDGGRLSISTHNAVVGRGLAASVPGLEPGEYVELAVTDTGHGMERATLDRIWEPFFTTKPRGKGTGLGLATVFGIVQQSGGAVKAESTPPLGSTFRVWLPRCHEGLTAAELPRPARRRLRGEGTILLVEDDELVRRFTCRALTEGGYQVIDIARPNEALDAWRTHRDRIRLIVTDVVMPVMSGTAMAECIREEAPDLPVVYISGYAPEGRLRHEAMSGTSRFLPKPFTGEALLDKVEDALAAAM